MSNKSVILDERIDEFHEDVPCHKSIQVLNEVCEETGAEIIVSSDRRRDKTLGEMRTFLKKIGVMAFVAGMTPETKFTNSMFLERDRAAEIEEYLEKNNIDKYVIVDDIPVYNNEFVPETTKDPRFVQTYFHIGLKQEGLKEKMIKILNE